VRRTLGTRHRSVDAQGLVRLILQSEVDLFWNGGIGTYVKASGEKNEDVGDRSNDGVRIDASQLRVKVVGEGGNLGMTQKARIEFALKGGRVNTDAIDNSAGVDCSDHEVNLKIFMQRLQEMGRVKDNEERDQILSEVTDQVCDAVLHNNYMQSLSISLDQRGCARNIEPYLQLIDRLVNAGLLDRAGEFLPTTKEVLARPQKSLTRPELAILLAYAKMQLSHTLLESSLCEEGNYRDYMRNYFPAGVRERYLDELDEHPLCHQITATVLTNTIVDTAGCARMSLLARQTARPLYQCAGMYLNFDRILEGDALRDAVFALDNRMASAEQYRIIDTYAETLQEMCFWALRQDMAISLDAEAVLQWRERIGEFINALPGVTPSQDWEKVQQRSNDLTEAGLDASLSQKVAALPYLRDFLPLFNLVEKTQSDLHDVACAHRDLMEKLGVPRLRAAAAKVPLRDRWDRMALDALERDLSVTLFRLTKAVLQETDGNVERYLSRRRQKYRALNNFWQQVQGTEPVNFNPFMVIGRALADLL
jgi:glutamate dehydrogenase